MKRIVLLCVGILAVIVLVVFSTGPSPTPEERKQMDILTGQLFVVDGVTNIISRARTMAAFDKQHEAVRYLRIASDFLEKENWPKDRPLRVVYYKTSVAVCCPLPPEIENQPIRWGGDYLYSVLIDKTSLTILSISQGG